MKFLAAGLLLILSVAASAQSSTQQLGRKAAEIRNLPYRTIPSKQLTQEQAATYVLRLLDQELEPRLTRTRETFLKRLWLMPQKSSIRGILGKLYAKQVRGIYDPSKKQYVVVKSGKGSQESATSVAAAMLGIDLTDIYTVHELQHAIQDQHFNLSRISKKVARHGDRSFAAQSLIEGDATAVMMDYALAQAGLDSSQVDLSGTGMGQVSQADLKSLGLEGMDLGSGLGGLTNQSMAGAPLYFQESLSQPYTQGLAFVQAVKKSGGWASVNRAFKRLPVSSEQIYHPEKFITGRDKPVTVSLRHLPPTLGSYKKLGEDTAGEFTVRVMAKQAGQPMSAAEGWGGDRYASYSNGRISFSVWNTTWDTNRDAREFEALVKVIFTKRLGRSSNGIWKRKGRYYFLGRQGKRVVVHLAAPESLRGQF